MTENLDPTSAAAPSPRRRQGRAALMFLLSLLFLLVGVMERRMMDHGACCAIECSDTPDPVACMQREREHAQQLDAADRAEKAAVGAFAGAAIGLGTAVVLLLRR